MTYVLSILLLRFHDESLQVFVPSIHQIHVRLCMDNMVRPCHYRADINAVLARIHRRTSHPSCPCLTQSIPIPPDQQYAMDPPPLAGRPRRSRWSQDGRSGASYPRLSLEVPQSRARRGSSRQVRTWQRQGRRDGPHREVGNKGRRGEGNECQR